MFNINLVANITILVTFSEISVMCDNENPMLCSLWSRHIALTGSASSAKLLASGLQTSDLIVPICILRAMVHG